MKILPIYFLALVFSVGLSSCAKEDPDAEKSMEAYRPVYMQRTEMEDVHGEGPRQMSNPGKIYYKDNYVFINERGQGIHILDNTDPSSPVNIAFISIPGNWDMAIKSSTLYVDNAIDLLAIDISDPMNIVINSRIKNAFPVNHFPDEFGVRFECVDETQGIVVGWELTQVDNPECWR